MTDGGSKHPIRMGDVVGGKYRVDRVLGEGGMGIVVAATHEHLGQRVALKFLLPAMAENVEIVQRFLREARAAVRIQSEHVARVLDVGTHEGSPYMVMEYLEGGDVARVLAERGELPVGEAVGYVLEACEAIAEAHALGIVHRDLKPANLFLAQRPTGKPMIKVLDFGISKAPATGPEANLTHASALMGSPSYMSPEQLVSATSVDHRADIWGLGVVLYEMLTRLLPFSAESMPELVGTILQQTAEPISSVRPGVPVGLERVIDRCLEKEPSRRFANVAEFARALLPFAPTRSEQSVERIEHVLGLAPATTPISMSAPATSGPGGSTFSPSTSHPLRSGGRKLLLSGVLVGLLTAALVVGAVLVSERSRHAAIAPSSDSATGSLAVVSPPPAAVPPPAPSLALAPTASEQAPPASTSEHPVAPAPKSPATSSRGPARPASAPPAAPSSTAAPECRTVSYFDTDGIKHFKQECR